MSEQVSELALVLPQSVLEFVTECRKQTYPLDARTNYDTGNPHEFGFRFERDGMVFVDVSTEQNGRFSGEEHVEIRSANPTLNGQKFYRIQYTGADEIHAKEVGSQTVAEVQHGMVIGYPTFVRFGSAQVHLRRIVGGRTFLYHESSKFFSWGRTNSETLSERLRSADLYQAVYRGASNFTLFEIR